MQGPATSPHRADRTLHYNRLSKNLHAAVKCNYEKSDVVRDTVILVELERNRSQQIRQGFGDGLLSSEPSAKRLCILAAWECRAGMQADNEHQAGQLTMRPLQLVPYLGLHQTSEAAQKHYCCSGTATAAAAVAYQQMCLLYTD